MCVSDDVSLSITKDPSFFQSVNCLGWRCLFLLVWKLPNKNYAHPNPATDKLARDLNSPTTSLTFKTWTPPFVNTVPTQYPQSSYTTGQFCQQTKQRLRNHHVSTQLPNRESLQSVRGLPNSVPPMPPCVKRCPLFVIAMR
jgi:hypothetical protein